MRLRYLIRAFLSIAPSLGLLLTGAPAVASAFHFNNLNLDPNTLLAGIQQPAYFCSQSPPVVRAAYNPDDTPETSQLLLRITSSVPVKGHSELFLSLILQGGLPKGLALHAGALNESDPREKHFSLDDVRQGALLNSNHRAIVLTGEVAGNRGNFKVDYLKNGISGERQQCALNLRRNPNGSWFMTNARGETVRELYAQVATQFPFGMIGTSSLTNCD
jgi:hypothetical protein